MNREEGASIQGNLREEAEAQEVALVDLRRERVVADSEAGEESEGVTTTSDVDPTKGATMKVEPSKIRWAAEAREETTRTDSARIEHHHMVATTGSATIEQLTVAEGEAVIRTSAVLASMGSTPRTRRLFIFRKAKTRRSLRGSSRTSRLPSLPPCRSLSMRTTSTLFLA